MAQILVTGGSTGSGVEDVFKKIAMCRRHDEAVGLGGDYVDQFVR